MSRERAPEAVAEQVAEPLDQLAAHARLRRRLGDGPPRGRMRTRRPAEPRKLTASSEDRVRRRDRADEHAGEPGAGERARRAADLELRVAVDELALARRATAGTTGTRRRRRPCRRRRRSRRRRAARSSARRRRTRAGSTASSSGPAEVAERRGSASAAAGRPRRPPEARRGGTAGTRRAPSNATSNALASRTRIAASGSASCETCVPNWLTVSRRPEPQEVGVPPEAACRPGPHVRRVGRGRADQRRPGAPRRARSVPARPRSARASRAGGAAARRRSRGSPGRRRSRRRRSSRAGRPRCRARRPTSAPIGIVPQTMKRMTEFIRPCSRGGQIACR